jgi:uncharacterized phiE125 gp8 family phage protein
MWHAPWLSRPDHRFLPELRPSVVIVGDVEEEIVSLTAMREFLRITTVDQTIDNRITSLIVSARTHAERHTHRSLVKKPYLMTLSRFPNFFVDRTHTINLWNPPLVGNVSIKYVDTDGVTQTLVSGTDFQVDFAGEPGRVAPIAQTPWPVTKFGVLSAVKIFYIAGYEVASTLRPVADVDASNVLEPETDAVTTDPGDSQVASIVVDRTIPNDLANGVMQLVAHWYQNRIPVVTIAGAGGSHVVLPWHVEKIFDDWTFDTLTPTITPEY